MRSIPGKFRFSITALFLTCSIITGCVQADTGSKEYIVRNVIDGDTIELANGRKVRYIGIDTPETMKRAGGEWVFDPESFAVTAKDRNRALVLGKKVRLEFDITREDKYGRWLAYVYTDDGTMVNSELIREGYATLYTFPPNVKYMDVFLEAQEEARRSKNGFWGALGEISPGEANDHIGKFRVVEGQITNTGLSPHMVFLDFGRGKKRHLTAVIFVRNLPLFAEEGIDPSLDYEGRSVEVVGKIEYENGPRIIIDNPSQISVLEK